MALAVAGSLGLSAPSSAQTGIDAQENVFGATNVNAVTGHGRLTAGVSRDGDLTVLSWPSPSYSDQLGYLTSNDFDARSQPRFGAAEGAGVFVGLRCEAGGSQPEVTWLRDRTAWTIEQDYGPDDGPHPHTRFRNDTLGLSVEVVDAIAPQSDTWVRRVEVTRDAQSPVQQAWLLTVANLSPQPTESRVAELPIVDWAKDGANDFAAAWHATEHAIIHFHPADQRLYRSLLQLAGEPSVQWGPVGDALTQASITAAEIDALLSNADASYGEGAWLALSTVPAPDQHQIGFDATPFCDQVDDMLDHIDQMPATFPDFESPLGPDLIEALRCARRPAEIISTEGWVYPADDGWTDAQDGELAGAGLAAGEVSEALRTPLAFDSGGPAEAAVVLGAGRTMADAVEALRAGDDASSVIDDSEAAVTAWLSGLTIPGSPGERAHAVARRALINLRVGTDAATGAVVASIARQPPYQLDWPRDGAFFNVLLDASGQTEIVERRL
jgi:hypothetical protein